MTSLLTTGSPADRDVLLKHLKEIRRVEGRIPIALVDQAASDLGLTRRHLWRLLADPVCKERNTRKEIPNLYLAQVAYFKHNGSAYLAYQELTKRNLLSMMDLRTFQRRISEWPPWMKACAKGGYREMIKHQMFNREHIDYRTQVYGTDHSQTGIQVIPERGNTLCFAWLSVLMDLHSRLILAYQVTTYSPGIADNISLLAEGIQGRETDRGFIGGKPEFLRTDRGGDYISDPLTLGLLRMDVERQFTEPYASHQNGRVERFHGTFDRDFAPSMPGFHKGGEESYTQRVLKTPVDVTTLMSIEQLDDRVGSWIEEYNARPRKMFGGKSSLDVWFASEHPIEKADADSIRAAMMRRTTRRWNTYGIELNGSVYFANHNIPDLRKGDTVEVRFHAHAREYVEVFRDGHWLFRAVESSTRSQGDIGAVVKTRKSQKEQAIALTRQAQYGRALDHREDLRKRGMAEENLPPLPTHPADADLPGRSTRLDQPTVTDNDDFDRPATADEIAALVLNQNWKSA